jgi:hypothetical protein
VIELRPVYVQRTRKQFGLNREPALKVSADLAVMGACSNLRPVSGAFIILGLKYGSKTLMIKSQKRTLCKKSRLCQSIYSPPGNFTLPGTPCCDFSTSKVAIRQRASLFTERALNLSGTAAENVGRNAARNLTIQKTGS